MKLIGLLSTAILSLIVAVPVYAQQEQHDQQEQKARPAQDEKKAQPQKSAEQGNENRRQEEKNTQQDKNKTQERQSAQPEYKNNQQENRNAQQQERNNQPEDRNVQQRSQPSEPARQAQRGSAGHIPDDRYRANFGQEHRFRVNQADYSNRRFQYGGYSFGFVDAWPNNWLYTQDVFVVEIDGVYYLCNASYPGINVELSFRE